MDEVREQLSKIAAEFVPEDILADRTNFDKSLKELGVDSLDAMTIFLNVQEKFGLPDIPEDRIEELRTLNDIAEYIQEVKARG